MRQKKLRLSSGIMVRFAHIVAVCLIVLSAIVVAGILLTPGLTLAGAVSIPAAGPHVWIVDGGAELAPSTSPTIQLTLEYLLLGLAALAIGLRLGSTLVARLQNGVDGGSIPQFAPATPRSPVRRLSPTVMRSPAVAAYRARKLHAVGA
jgi:hypothetical protein